MMSEQNIHMNIRAIIELKPELLESAIKDATSVTDILRRLNIQSTNNNARRKIIDFAEAKGLDLPIYSQNKKTGCGEELSREEVLNFFIKGDRHYGTKVRKLVLKYNLIEYKCHEQNCQLVDGMWGSKKVEYQVDHINGDNTDNRLENLRFLCVMCHSFTDTYGGRNAKNSSKNLKTSKCIECKNIFKGSFYCEECSPKIKDYYIFNTPSISFILSEMEKASLCSVSKKYFLNRAVLKKIRDNPKGYTEYPRKRNIINMPSKLFLQEIVNKYGLKYVAERLNVEMIVVKKILS